MLDDKTKMDERDRNKWADGEKHEATYLAMRCAISLEQAKELIGKLPRAGGARQTGE